MTSFGAASHGIESGEDATDLAGALQAEGQRRNVSTLAIARLFINYMLMTSLLVATSAHSIATDSSAIDELVASLQKRVFKLSKNFSLLQSTATKSL